MQGERKSLDAAPSSSTPARSNAAGCVGPGPFAVLADVCFDLQSSETSGADAHAFAMRLLGCLSSSDNRVLGLLGRCQLPGCDIHFITHEHEIISHLETSTPIAREFKEARDYWRSPHDGAIAVIVYSDRMDVVFLDGNTLRMTKASR